MYRLADPVRGILMLLFTALSVGHCFAEDMSEVERAYTVKPGDLLEVSVWKEADLQREVLVRPDGGFSLPLVGDVSATGRSVEELQQEIASRLEKYIPDPVVSVAVQQIVGNAVYVIGKVNRPGQLLLNHDLDVMQALSIAGGTTPFASLNKIIILRRQGERQLAIPFRYGDVEDGENLGQNIILRSGDVVVVP